MKSLLLLPFMVIFFQQLLAQEYTVNGNATKDNCHCYTLTPNQLTQSGSVWNNIKIDLTKSFDFTFDINLGCDDAGADGIVFVLQPISTSVGTSGGGLGFEGVKPSVGVTIDTWQNAESNDPAYDHIAIQLNGNINHLDLTSNIAGPVTALAGSDNIEDCKQHLLNIKWDVTTKHLAASIDGSLRVEVFKDFVAEVFGGNPLVFWGFTGSTGGARNLQQVCTALKPGFRFLPDQKRCINEPVTFFDSTVSFAPVLSKYWDFGDGSPLDSVNQNPTHTYSTAGDYTVKQKVTGADGCVEINTQVVKIGSIPVANFSAASGCISKTLQLSDQSLTAVGTINQWQWIVAAGDTLKQKDPTVSFTTAGIKNISLVVKSQEGCVSPSVTKTLEVYPSPVVNFNASGLFCKKSAIQFTNLSTVPNGSIAGTQYDFGNGQQSAQPNPVMRYDSSKNYNITLTATSDKGCSQSKLKSIFILQSPLAKFGYHISCEPVTVNFKDSSKEQGGTTVTKWWWQLGNGSTAANQNPSVPYNISGNITVKLVATSSNGCPSDTLVQNIFVPSVPVAKFGYSLPLCSTTPVSFTDSSSNSNGAFNGWEWLVNGQPAAALQHPVLSFITGSQRVQLIVKNEAGCSSDTATALLQVSPNPVIAIDFLNGCKGDSIAFTGSVLNGTIITNWRWDFGNGKLSGVQTATGVYSDTGKYKIVLSAISQAGCSTVADSSIQIFGTDAFAGNDTIVAANQPVQLHATGGSFYHWTPAINLTSDSVSNPIATLGSSQRYTVTVTSPVGCPSIASIFLKVYDGPEIYVPKAFTPNGDLLNDKLKAFPVGMRQFKNFTIFNRLGEIVFATSNPANGWDGFYKGRLQPTGAYIWIASAINYKGAEVVRKGTVILLK